MVVDAINNISTPHFSCSGVFRITDPIPIVINFLRLSREPLERKRPAAQHTVPNKTPINRIVCGIHFTHYLSPVIEIMGDYIASDE